MEAKKALDSIIRKSRVHLYKPIQIAEILFHDRTAQPINMLDLDTYRNVSKRWRDKVSNLLVGRSSASSQKFQDNLFEENALPPRLIQELSKINKEQAGIVEAYVYRALEARLSSVKEVEDYIKSSTADSFSLKELVALFQATPGLRRSVDKMYEILVYALFSSIVKELKAQIILEIGNKDKEILYDFESFIKVVLGLDANNTKRVLPAALYRVGVTNAADRGLDMWSNFGPAVQVKHLTLTPELVEDIAEGVTADQIVVVCISAEKDKINALLQQVGWGSRIQGIVTIDDLHGWYALCLSDRYRGSLGASLLNDLKREFELEFPSGKEIVPFMKERGYTEIVLPPDWKIQI